MAIIQSIINYLLNERAAFFWFKVLGIVVSVSTLLYAGVGAVVDLRDRVVCLEHTSKVYKLRLNTISLKDLNNHIIFYWISEELKIEYRGSKALRYKYYLIECDMYYRARVRKLEHGDQTYLNEPDLRIIKSGTYIKEIKHKVDYIKNADITKLSLIDEKVGLYYLLSVDLYALNLYKNELTRDGDLHTNSY